jgi:type VI secretion system protein ImpA
VLKNVRRHSLQDVATMLSTVRECKPILQEIDSLIYALQGSNSPSWQKLSKVLENFEYVFMSISPDALSAEQAPSAGIAPGQPLSNTATLENTCMDQALEDSQYTAGVWSSREQAYKTLEQLAEYLATIEPHSPTPYLIRRAVKWGQLPLAELIQEVLNEEGDLNGMLAMMGLSRH